MQTPYRYTDPVPPTSATGPTGPTAELAELYAQIAADFGIAEPAPFVVLSASPELAAATWALMRESLLDGPGPRNGKTVAALGVSLANRCPFCVDAHTLLLHAGGAPHLADAVARDGAPDDEHHARVLAWAKATRTPGAPELATAPFPDAHAPGYIGTVLAFHFINRVVSALLTENLLPEGVRPADLLRGPEGEALSRAVRRTPAPGASLAFLDPRFRAAHTDLDGPADGDNSADSGPGWAAGTPVAPAYAAFREVASMGAGLLSEEDQALVTRTVADWDGAHPPVRWPELPGTDRPGARLAVLAAVAPYRLTDDDVAAWLTPPRTDHCLVHLVAYGAFLAVTRVEHEIGTGRTGTATAPSTGPEPS
ncbi:carboxymuconolactone decarboxylase family protein [Streptomyces boluensis]|uniref:DNA-binding protein n=1 Tax=Streptomyces boluensis TaxID=1775135 RepID=A0A964XNJ7_9ACTN|nr:carboxymuconolactone decarboxylase family protein [Streptomyces boluensis]NBE55555.1 DNA-binding protein [Streptomyces boluensis]